MLNFNFESKGYLVFAAENGIKALELVKQHKIDVVLTDVRMPSGSGFDLLDAVKDVNPAVPSVLFMSGFHDFSLQEAFAKGVDAVFHKPLALQALDEAVARIKAKTDRLWKMETQPAVDFKIDLPGRDLREAQASKAISLGRGGMFVAFDEDFPRTDSIVGFRFRAAGASAPVVGVGKARWVRTEKKDLGSTGCGIEFLALSDTLRHQVLEHARETKCIPYIPRL